MQLLHLLLVQGVCLRLGHDLDLASSILASGDRHPLALLGARLQHVLELLRVAVSTGSALRLLHTRCSMGEPQTYA